MKQRKTKILIALLATVLLLGVYFHLENTQITVTQVEIQSSKLPEAFEDFTIVQVSDLHNTSFGSENQKLLQKIRKADPDAIFITGDIVDVNRTDLHTALDFAGKAVTIAPTYYVNGNHEAAISEYPRLERGLMETGVTVLNDRATTIHAGTDSIQLIGFADPSFQKYQRKITTVQVFQEALEKINPEDGMFTIVLSHRPEVFPYYASTGYDLFFTGHAHGGQFRLPFIGGLYVPNQGLFPKYAEGVHTQGGTSMIVSRGLGNSSVPVRINNNPELVVVTLKRSEA